jgi:hypothetical protein
VTVRVDVHSGAAALAFEAQARNHGLYLPACQTPRWAQIHGSSDFVLMASMNAKGIPEQLTGVAVLPSRALARHGIYRVERLAAGSADHDEALFRALVATVTSNKRCLRLVVELFERADDARMRMADTLSALGFRRVSEPRMYERTVALDVGPSVDATFAGLDKTARRHIRAPAKRGFEVRPVTDVALASRVEAIVAETFNRTGGAYRPLPWDAIIEWSIKAPSVSRIVGLFDGADASAAGLIAVAWGCNHGSHVTYEVGAGTRKPELGSMPVSYAPLWHLIEWAHGLPGVSWFDLGGATTGRDDDPLRGNLEFKRYFSERIIDVAQEWHFEPHPTRAAVAAIMSRGARSLTRLLGRGS